MITLFLFVVYLCLNVAVTDIELPSPNLNDEEENIEQFDRDNFVYILTDENFDKFLLENPTALVLFYIPTCHECDKLALEFSSSAKELEKVSFAKVDCSVNQKLKEQYKVVNYPTIKLFNNDKTIDKDTFSTSSELIDWLKSKINKNENLKDNAVVTLTAENFDKFISDKPIVLVIFYAPSCKRCKQVALVYEKAAKILKKHNIPLAKVDANIELKLANQYEINKIPYLIIIRNGQRFNYDGGLSADSIVDYMLEQKKPAAKELNSVNEAKNFLLYNDVTIFGFFDSLDGKLYDSFIEAAEKVRDSFTVGYTTNDEIKKYFNAKDNSIVMHYPEIFWSKYEPKSVSFDRSSATVEELITFYRDNAAPLVGQRTRKNAATRYFKLPLVVVYYGVDFSIHYREGTQYWRRRILKIANKFKDKNFKFCVADEDEFAAELVDAGIDESGLDQNVIVFGADRKKYPMDPETYENSFSETLEAFLNNIIEGKVKPYVKSADLPKNNKAPVKTLVALNFENIVNDNSKDVLIEFYAPWCSHCKSFEPKYNQLAARHKLEQPNLIIAKFDTTANDVPLNYTVRRYPTIYFAPSGKKNEPILYLGNRGLVDLEDFMKKHAVVSFKKHEEL